MPFDSDFIDRLEELLEGSDLGDTDIEALLDRAEAEESQEDDDAIGPTLTSAFSETDTFVSDRSTTFGKTFGRDVSLTQQTSRRFFDVPTEEEFLNEFENAYAGFISGMQEAGVGPKEIGLALDPATGIINILMQEYMGNIAQRAAAGEDIFELVGTEEDFELLRTEPGTESVTKGKGTQTQKSQTVGGGTSVSGTTGKSTTKATAPPAGADPREVGGPAGDPESELASQSLDSSESRTQRESVSTQRHETRTERDSRFREQVELLSRPKVAAVFKFSPTQFLEERFGGDEGEFATFVQSRKGEAARRRETLTGGPSVTARRV